MELKKILSKRIGIKNIREIVLRAQDSEPVKHELYELLTGDNEAAGYRAAWVFTHFSAEANKWLYKKQDELIEQVLECDDAGKRRLILSLLFKQPFTQPVRVDFLDFCMERMMSKQELPGVRALCMKISYELCRPFPELKQELKTMLEIMEGELAPAVNCVRKNIRKAMEKDRSLQRF